MTCNYEVEADDGHDYAQDTDEKLLLTSISKFGLMPLMAAGTPVSDSSGCLWGPMTSKAPIVMVYVKMQMTPTVEERVRTHDGAAQVADDFAALEGRCQGQDIGQGRRRRTTGPVIGHSWNSQS